MPSRYRYNAGTWSTSHAGGEEYRFGSIDLYNYRYEPPEVVSDCIEPDLANRRTQERPYVHTLESFNERTQPPQGPVRSVEDLQPRDCSPPSESPCWAHQKKTAEERTPRRL